MQYYSRRMEIRLTEKDYQKIKKDAEKAGMTYSTYIRKLIRHSKVCDAPPVNFIKLIQLTKQIESDAEQILLRIKNSQAIEVKELRKQLDEWRELQDIMWDAYRPIDQ